MAKKKIDIKPTKEIEVVYSKKYRCFITKSESYFCPDRQDYLSVKIENSLKDNKNYPPE